ncbi:hypothetical protein A5724_18530 [Mycobacterium sp. ACS1612]|uniref:hypothetical protein n=1 Tax=Mycobacterium sp. ACS1612 TaxID=1834117 RepID=UPI0007FDE45D|nr:hypothetical protein [Mycobacterium sp. ACS1612]OBF33570.1 hypothetical protein A5724_18530 [Mycobacterium sp. ACS1612]
MTGSERWQAPTPTTDGRQPRRHPEDTVERRITWWQRALRWIAWLAFLGLAVYHSQSVYFSPLEWLALIAAIAISIWCMAKPLGGPKYELREPTHLLGAFVSRTSWGLVLFGGLLTLGGIAGSMAAIYDVSTGRATVSEVFTDIGVFIEGWLAEMIAPTYDAELENTHAYALFILLIPGLLLLFINLVPFFKGGMEFQVHPDGLVSVRSGEDWAPLLEYEYATVAADGTTITFTPPPGGPPTVVLPQDRVFSRQYGVRLQAKVSAEFFRRLLAGRGFNVDSESATSSSFTATRP